MADLYHIILLTVISALYTVNAQTSKYAAGKSCNSFDTFYTIDLAKGCRYYLTCFGGVFVSQKCQKNFLWSTQYQQCVAPAVSDCPSQLDNSLSSNSDIQLESQLTQSQQLQNQSIEQQESLNPSQQQPTYSQQQPTYSQQQPTYSQQQPTYSQQQPTNSQQQQLQSQQKQDLSQPQQQLQSQQEQNLPQEQQPQPTENSAAAIAASIGTASAKSVVSGTSIHVILKSIGSKKATHPKLALVGYYKTHPSAYIRHIIEEKKFKDERKARQAKRKTKLRALRRYRLRRPYKPAVKQTLKLVNGDNRNNLVDKVKGFDKTTVITIGNTKKHRHTIDTGNIEATIVHGGKAQISQINHFNGNHTL